MHLIDHGRNHLEKTFKRPIIQRIFRNFLSLTLPNPRVFKTLNILENDKLQNYNRNDGLGDYAGSADLSGETENINSPLNIAKAAASVPFNFIKGAIGNPLNPGGLTQVSLTQAQKQRLNEIAQAKGTVTGNIDYSDYSYYLYY